MRHIGAKFRCEVARSSETRKLLGEQFLNFGHNFLETGELWSKYMTLLKNSTKKLQAPKISWAKVQKQKSYWVINFGTLVPIFSKLVNFGPHILKLLEVIELLPYAKI